MPGKVKVKIISGRNLPVMDRSSDTTDAYVEIKLGTTTYKTDVCRKSLHPQWNSEWYRFEVDDSELQDEPLQIRLMDHDTYSANDAIGKVYIDLNPLLLPASSLIGKWNDGSNSSHEGNNSVMTGWIPVYDTMHGIRGEVNVIVKVELFTDFNKFRQSSCGVPFYCSPAIPHGFYGQVIHGFVEELVVNDDPEYQWIDKIRTPRASNEARQTLFFKLSGELQRKIGLKALDLGGNAVVGYHQCFDLEGESGIVARGIGTAVTLMKINDYPSPTNEPMTTTTTATAITHDERTQNYLNFLGAAHNFHLTDYTSNQLMPYDHPFKLPAPISSRKSDLLKSGQPSALAPLLTRHLSAKEFKNSHQTPSSSMHHSMSLQTLLKQEDMRGRPGQGISQHFRNLKYSSQHLLTRKVTALKARLAIDDELITNNMPKRSLLAYRRTKSDTTGMAEILVRSVFDATSSLDCIAESPKMGVPNTSQLDVDEDVRDSSFLSLPNTSQLNISASSENDDEDEEGYDDDEDEDDEEEEDLAELDSVSHIVETVRKLSMIHPISGVVDNTKSERKEPIFSLADEDDSNANLLYYEQDLHSTKVSESFFPQFANTFKLMKNSRTARSLSHFDISENSMQKFVSLHNIHDTSAKVNKYSAHEGKDTVLGHMFKRLSRVKAHGPVAETQDQQIFISSPTVKNADEKHESFLHKLKESLHHPKDLFHWRDMNPVIQSQRLPEGQQSGVLQTALGNVLMENVNEKKMLDCRTSTNATSSQLPDPTKSQHKHVFKPPKVMRALKTRFSKEGKITNDRGLLNLALGNVLMDSVQEVLATPGTTPCEIQFSKVDTDELEPSYRHGILEKIKEAPRELLRAATHAPTVKDGRIKNEHGLLNIALENVLMDSAQEVLVTSHVHAPPAVPSTSSTPLPSRNANVSNDAPCFLKGPENNIANERINTQVDEGNHNTNNSLHACLTYPRSVDMPSPDTRTEISSHPRTESLSVRISHSPAKLGAIPCMHRRSSESDLSSTPKGNSLTGSDRSGGYSSGQFLRASMVRTTVPQENFDIMEYPFLTMSKYPQGFIAHIGGSVSARSVKLLERISNIDEPESRDTWWSEIRMEIRSHARALNCNAVLAYTETTSICDDVCILSASGTATVIGCQYSEASDCISGLPIIPKSSNVNIMSSSLDRNDFDKVRSEVMPAICPNLPVTAKVNIVPNTINSSPEKEKEKDAALRPSCAMCHLPYMSNVKPLRNSTLKCQICGTAKVPDMMIATIEIPDGMPSIGRGCFVQSYVCRPLRDLKGESNAKEISDGLPFLEYELHRFLVNKLKIKGMNAIFGLKVRISVGERLLIGIATGTAVLLSALPPPQLPKLICDRSTDEKKFTQLQRNLFDTIKKNREIYQLQSIDETNGVTGKLISDTDDSEEEPAALDLSNGNKDCCILEVDDPEDVDVLTSLLEPRPPDGFHVVNTEHVPGLEELEIVKNLQMFTQIWRAKIAPSCSLDKHFHRLLQSVYFKLRRMIPCALCDLQFRVDSPEPDEIQLCVLGMALGLGDPQKNGKVKRKNAFSKKSDDDLIFNLEEDQIPEHTLPQNALSSSYLGAQFVKHRQKSPVRNRILTKQRHVPYRERHGVDITPLSYVPGGKIEKYLGNINFFFIRESTSLREEGGLSGFVHSFITEILAIVRAHVTALGGNAMVAYFITECVLNHNLHKNQGQCLINVGGDVVFVSYFNEDH